MPVDRDDRISLFAAAGADTISALLLEDGTAVVGDDSIGTYLDGRFDDPPEAEAHRLKAEKARRRSLEEECKCLHNFTPSHPQASERKEWNHGCDQ